MKAIDFFRALDDSDLDPYETRFLLRVWRRGQCWETLESIANSTGMSIGKASQVRNRLERLGWLVQNKIDGRKVWEVALPGSEVEPISEPEISPDENVISPHEEIFHQVKPEFHQVKPEFHVVGALPLIGPNEVDPIKYRGEPTHDAATLDVDDGNEDEERAATKRAVDATLELVQFWQELARRKRPKDEGVFRETWFKPFNEIWIACGRDVDAAKAKVQAVRNDMLAQGMTIFDPGKLAGHVQTMIDRELLPLTQRMNGNGRHTSQSDTPAVKLKEIAPGLY